MYNATEQILKRDKLCVPLPNFPIYFNQHLIMPCFIFHHLRWSSMGRKTEDAQHHSRFCPSLSDPAHVINSFSHPKISCYCKIEVCLESSPRIPGQMFLSCHSNPFLKLTSIKTDTRLFSLSLPNRARTASYGGVSDCRGFLVRQYLCPCLSCLHGSPLTYSSRVGGADISG